MLLLRRRLLSAPYFIQTTQRSSGVTLVISLFRCFFPMTACCWCATMCWPPRSSSFGLIVTFTLQLNSVHVTAVTSSRELFPQVPVGNTLSFLFFCTTFFTTCGHTHALNPTIPPFTISNRAGYILYYIGKKANYEYIQVALSCYTEYKSVLRQSVLCIGDFSTRCSLQSKILLHNKRTCAEFT